MTRGILETIGLAAAIAVAAPLALFGISMLVDGRPSGMAFLGLAALFVIVSTRLPTPGDLPGRMAERFVGSVVEEPEE